MTHEMHVSFLLKKGKILNEFKLTNINLNILEILILIFLVLLGIFSQFSLQNLEG